MPKLIYYLLVALGILCLLPPFAYGQWIAYETKIIAEGLNVPWEIRWAFDDWIWFTERSGRFTKVDPATGKKKVLLHLLDVDHTKAERGTLGFDSHPDFPQTPYVYIAYNYVRDDRKAFNVVRWTYTSDTLLDPAVILDDLPTGDIHNGSRIKVGPDRKLYVTTGEADIPALSQQMESKSGKILRLELDGSIPADNPFSGSSIFTLGHRNPQGLAFAPNGKIYSTEHGHASDDEFNLIERGRNYGWPAVEGYCNTEAEFGRCAELNVRQPLAAWTPTLAVTGIEYADHSMFPEWKNAFLLATLKDASLWVLKLDEVGEQVIAQYRYPLRYTHDSTDLKRLRDYCFSPDGRLFVSTSNIWTRDWNPDRIVEIKRLHVVPFEIVLVHPAQGEQVKAANATFSWLRTAGDSRYQFQLSTSTSFELASTKDRVTNDTSVTIAVDPAVRDQYWRVRELTSEGFWGAPRLVRASPAGVPEEDPAPTVVYHGITSNKLAFDANGVETGRIILSDGAELRRLTTDELARGFVDITRLSSGHYFLQLTLSRSSRVLPFNVIH